MNLSVPAAATVVTFVLAYTLDSLVNVLCFMFYFVIRFIYAVSILLLLEEENVIVIYVIVIYI